MINPKKKKRPYLDYDLEGYIKGQQTARTDATSNQQATTQRQVAENNTSEKVQQRRVANERRKTQEAYEKGKRDYERQQQAAKVQEDIESRPWWNPTTVLRNAKDIPIFGAAPTATEWAYGLMNKAIGNDAAGDYYMQDADKSATGQAIALAAIPAHTNPYTAAIYDTALLAPWAKELDAQGKFYHPETLTGEEAAMLGLSFLPFGMKYRPQLSYAKTAAEDAALQSSIPWVRDNARGLYLSRAINQAADQGVQAPIKVNRTVERDGTIRMSLPSHTSEQPRQFVIDPQGNNKYYIHMKTWDGKKVPANLSAAEKNALFESVYNELPEGAEILFPKSSEDYLATRGTVAGLQRLSRDPRFEVSSPGTLQYWDDKTKSVKTYNGTSFIKKPKQSATQYVIENSEPINVPTINWQQATSPQKLTKHLQGEEAVKMFKEYGGEQIPEGSINGEQIRKYVPEARERYGLVGNDNITDEEIAQALYKHSKELGGNTAAVNAQGEPQLLFRGDTRRYTELKERMSPEELAKKSGTMDNSLGNLFLGEFPNSFRGVDRYIGTWQNFNGSAKLIGSGTGSRVTWDGKTAPEIEGFPLLGPRFGGGYKLYSYPMRYGNIDVYKLPASMMESGVNDLNAFIVRTPQMRNASNEISVLNDDWMLQGATGSHFMSKNYKYNPETGAMKNVKTGESLGEITTESAPESRVAIGDHYKELLKEAEQKQQGLLKSEADSPLRYEHSQYSYYALPNFNIGGAKHLLPYDLRIPRDWKDKNIYRGLSIPIILGSGYSLYKTLNNNQQIQVQKNGGKILPPWY